MEGKAAKGFGKGALLHERFQPHHSKIEKPGAGHKPRNGDKKRAGTCPLFLAYPHGPQHAV
jgi:hypothetical protein